MRRLVLLRLFRFPGLALAVAGAAAILAGVSASGAPFLGSTTSATLHRYLAADAAFRLPTVSISADSSISADVIEYRTDLLRRALGPSLGEPIVTVRGDTVVATAHDEAMDVRIVSRTGALEHVDVVTQVPGPGVWVADSTAEALSVGPGSSMRIDGTFGATEVAVVGIYRDLLTAPRTPYWASLDNFIYPPPGSNTRPPAFLLMDLETYVVLDDRLLDDQDAMTWEFRLPTETISMDRAQDLKARLDRFSATLTDSSLEIGSAFRASLNEPLSGWIDSTTEVSDSIAGPVNALALAGRVLALAVLAGSGMFMMRRRRVELAILDARGVGPLRLGARTVAEVLFPVAVGAAVGTALALLAVDRLGPGGAVSSDVAREAVVSVAWTSLIAVFLLGIVAARSLGDQSGSAGGAVRRAASWVPWDVILLMLAGFAFVGLRAGEGTESGQGIPELDPLFLLFPVLLLAGAAGLAARGLRLLLPRLRSLGSSWRPGVYLASRRLAAASRLAAALIVASSVAVGILVYAGTISASLAESATQASALTVGADVAVRYTGSLPETSDAPVPMTRIVRVGGASLASDADTDVDVLLVDPATFAEAAFWRSEFADSSVESLMESLAASGDRVPAIVAGQVRVPEDALLLVPGFNVSVRVVERARTFPGSVGERPVVVMARDAMATSAEASGSSLDQVADGYAVWVRGDGDAARSFVRTNGATVLSSISVEGLRNTPRYLAVTATLGFLQSLGVVAGVVVLIGGYLYLQNRQRQAETSYVLARRMGMRRASYRRSVALEVAGLLLGSFVIGASIAALASLLVNEEVQARAVEAVVPLFRIPIPLVAGTGAVLLAFSMIGAWLVQRGADRADVAEVMRVAE